MRTTALRAQLAILQQRVPRGMLLGLDRVHDALASLGSPHESVPCVHIAGTNGKGSTAAMVEAILRGAGLRTGLYTSPHLCRFAERIRIDGEPIDDDAFAAALAAVLGRCGADLTVFESLTIAAFHAFRTAAIDVAVLEVGLGGRLDATNVISKPLATAITSIALEHTEFLGATLALIAREKAGILKRGAPVVLGPLDEEAHHAITAVAAEVSAGPIRRVVRVDSPLSLQGGWGGEICFWEDDGVVEIAGGRPDLRARAELALAGSHQAENAAVAAGVAFELAPRFPSVLKAIGPGLAAARWPGRLERIARGEITVLLDCAHNLHGIEALAAALRRDPVDPARTALVFGALADKPWEAMLRQLAPFARRRYYTEPKGRAPAPLEGLRGVAEGEPIPAPWEALERAVASSGPGDTVIVAGSIYLVGEVRAGLLGIEADPIIAL